jgi:hypothetical protein
MFRLYLNDRLSITGRASKAKGVDLSKSCIIPQVRKKRVCSSYNTKSEIWKFPIGRCWFTCPIASGYGLPAAADGSERVDRTEHI